MCARFKNMHPVRCWAPYDMFVDEPNPEVIAG